MALWIILTVLTSLAVVGLTIPLVRRYDDVRARETGIAILRRQLGEIDAQVAAGVVGGDDAEGMRNEIKRRILAEGRQSDGPSRVLSARAVPWLAAAMTGIVALAATLLYALIGRPASPAPQAPPSSQASADAPAHPVADVATMIAELEAKMRANPNDVEGWRMLGWSYNQVGRSADAAEAYGRAAALDPNNAEYPSARGDALVSAARGQVTPDALAAFKSALKIDPADPRARFYFALYEDQQGQHDKAMGDWIALLKSAPSGAAWPEQVRGFVERTAKERHIDLAGKLPPESAPAAPSGAPGPTESQAAAANAMPPADRQAMIEGMVDKLAGELKAHPQNADGWMRLMRARMVLGETDKAQAAFHQALQAFAGDPNGRQTLRTAAQSLGIPAN